jgi:tetratricopeptide (TPR) repeat protein
VPKYRRLFVVAGSGFLAGMMMIAWVQTGYWHDDIMLWRHALQCDNLSSSGAPNALVRHQLGSALAQTRGGLNESAELFREALAINPQYPEARINLAHVLERQGHYKEALSEYREYQMMRPEDGQTLCCIAACLAKLGKADEAIPMLQEQLDRRLNVFDALNSLGDIYADKKQWDKAADYWDKALRCKPDRFVLRYNLAQTQLRCNKPAEAIANLRTILDQHPTDVQTLGLLAWTLATHPDAQFRDGQKALQYAGQAVELTRKQDPVQLSYFAAAHAECGEMEDAVFNLEQAANMVERGGDKETVKEFNLQLECYRANKPFREDPAKIQ